MARLKRIVKSALEDRSPRFLLATIALGVAISLRRRHRHRLQGRTEPVQAGQAGRATSAKPGRRPRKPTRPQITAAPDLTGAVFSPVRKNVLRHRLRQQEARCTSRSAPKTRIAVAQAREGIEHHGRVARAVPAELGEPDHRDRGRRAPGRGAHRRPGDGSRARNLDDAQEPDEGLGRRDQDHRRTGVKTGPGGSPDIAKRGPGGRAVLPGRHRRKRPRPWSRSSCCPRPPSSARGRARSHVSVLGSRGVAGDPGNSRAPDRRDRRAARRDHRADAGAARSRHRAARDRPGARVRSRPSTSRSSRAATSSTAT